MSPLKRSLHAKPREVEDDLPPKRLRGGGLEDDEQLYLDEMDMMEEEEEASMPPPPPPDMEDAGDDAAGSALGEVLPQAERWKRPPLRPDLSNSDTLHLQWLDMDVVSGQPVKAGLNELESTKQLGSQEGAVPILRTYGVTDEGPSICVFIHGFTPYGCFAVPPDCKVDHAQLDELRASLQDLLVAQRGKQDARVLAVEHLSEHRSIMGYEAPVKDFLKVYVNLPGHIPALRRIMEDGVQLPGVVRASDGGAPGLISLQPYENNVPFVLRFMVDQGLGGAGWLTLPSKTYQIRTRKETHCQVRSSLCQ
jgi:DNA polymerase delta subunit 1